MTIILLLCPGIIASAYYCKLKGISIKSINFLLWCVIYILLINVLIFSIAYLRGHKNSPSNEMFIIIGNAARYGILGLISALAIPNILFIISKLIREEKNEK